MVYTLCVLLLFYEHLKRNYENWQVKHTNKCDHCVFLFLYFVLFEIVYIYILVVFWRKNKIFDYVILKFDILKLQNTYMLKLPLLEKKHETYIFPA